MSTGTWVNADGLVVKFGGFYRNPPENFARALTEEGFETYEFTYDLSKVASGATTFTTDRNNDGTLDGFSRGDVPIPANSMITRVLLVPTEAAAGGTSIILGLYQEDGTAIDDSGLITATEGVLANLDAVGSGIQGQGALALPSSGVFTGTGSVDAYVALKATGTFTAGKGKVIIEFLRTQA